MRKIVNTILLFSLPIIAFTQIDSSKIRRNRFEEFRKNNPDYATVGFAYEIDNKAYIDYTYYLHDSIFTLNYDNTKTGEFFIKEYEKDILFDYLGTNWNYIEKLHKHYYKIGRDSLLKNVRKPQLGIRYKNIFYNHFLPTTQKQVDSIKNEDVKNGCLVINAIVDFFERTFKEYGTRNNK